MSIELAFKGERKLTKEEIKTCWKLIDKITYYGILTGKQLAHEMELPQPTIRKFIQIIREYNNVFFLDGQYLIALPKGYKITDNKKALAAYHHKLQVMTHSKVMQLDKLTTSLEHKKPKKGGK